MSAIKSVYRRVCAPTHQHIRRSADQSRLSLFLSLSLVDLIQSRQCALIGHLRSQILCRSAGELCLPHADVSRRPSASEAKQRGPDPKDQFLNKKRTYLHIRDSILRLQHRFLIKDFLSGPRAPLFATHRAAGSRRFRAGLERLQCDSIRLPRPAPGY